MNFISQANLHGTSFSFGSCSFLCWVSLPFSLNTLSHPSSSHANTVASGSCFLLWSLKVLLSPKYLSHSAQWKRCLGHVQSPDVSPQPLGVVALLLTYGAIQFMGLHSLQDKLIFCVLHVPAEVNPCSFHPPAEDIMLVLSIFYNLLRNGDLLNCLSFSSRWLRKRDVLPFPFRVVPHQVLLRVDFGVLLCQVKLL